MKYSGIDPESGKSIELIVENGRIVAIEEKISQSEDLPFISHGFLDMQVNGYNGSDYSLDDLDRRHIDRIIKSLAASGTTQHVPTIVTRAKEQILKNLRMITRSRHESSLIDSAIAGIHIEGPFISGEDGPRGAHDLRYVRDPNFEEFLEWQDAAEGLVKIVTIAPEREGALEFIEKVVKTGVIAAIGHSAASPERIREAIAAGCTLSTHLGNGSHASVPRLRNYIWEQMAADRLAAGIIADGFHLPESVIKVMARAKGLNNLILVSDVALIGGYPRGVYRWGNLDVEVFEDGHIGLPGTTFLAGAAHLLDWDIPTFMRFTGATLGDTIRLCTVNPARILSRIASAGRLTPNSPANIVLFRFEKGDKRLKVEKTLINGEEIE